MPEVNLTTLDQNSIQKFDDSSFNIVSKSADYLCRVQLNTAKSKLFLENKAERGHYLYIVRDDQFKDLGKEMDCLPLCWRPKALDMNSNPPVSIYDVNSAAFKTIAAKAAVSNSMCAYGPEFLVWLPTIKTFASFFMGSQTARGDSKDVRARLLKPSTLTHRICKNKKGQTWETPIVKPCSTPFDGPEEAALREAIDKFNNEASAPAPVPADAPTRER